MFRPFLALCELNVDHIEQHVRFDYRIFLSLNRSNFFFIKEIVWDTFKCLEIRKGLEGVLKWPFESIEDVNSLVAEAHLILNQTMRWFVLVWVLDLVLFGANASCSFLQFLRVFHVYSGHPAKSMWLRDGGSQMSWTFYILCRDPVKNLSTHYRKVCY